MSGNMIQYIMDVMVPRPEILTLNIEEWIIEYCCGGHDQIPGFILTDMELFDFIY